MYLGIWQSKQDSTPSLKTARDRVTHFGLGTQTFLIKRTLIYFFSYSENQRLQWHNGTANSSIIQERIQTSSKGLEAASRSIIQERIRTFFQGIGTSKLQYHSGKSSMIPSRNRHFSTSDKVTSDKAQVGSKISAKNHAILWRHQVTN